MLNIETRVIPINPNTYIMDPKKLYEYVDRNTIAVIAVLGSTFTGHLDDIKQINDILKDIKKSKKIDVPIHVDAAIGGFIIPFIKPDLVWDFRLKHVASINFSNHKYGLVYPGMGCLILRSKKLIPKKLIYQIDYLSKNQESITVNFSKNSFPIIQQYYNFLKFGYQGYKNNAQKLLELSNYMADLLKSTGVFDIINNDKLLPAVYFKVKPDSNVNLKNLAAILNKNGINIPVYNLPPVANSQQISRIVIRTTFTKRVANKVYFEIIKALNK